MDDITLRQYLDGKSIWGRVLPLVLIPELGSIGAVVLDKNLILNHGDKNIFYKIPLMGLDDIAKDIGFNYKKKWEDLISIKSLNLNIGADNTHKISETLTHAETRINTQENINKVSAFNTDGLLANDGSNSNNSDDIDYSKVKTLTDENLSLETAFNNLSLSQKNIIIRTVNNDISSLLTLDIY